MQLKKYSRDELMEFLVNGILIPDTALTNENTIGFYFEELESFINIAENDYYARSTDYLEITISFGDLDYIIIRSLGGNLVLFMDPETLGDIENINTEDAKSVVGLVYGIIVYNEKWKEISNLADNLMKGTPTSVLTNNIGNPLKINSIEMENLKEFIKQNKKYL
tara:strand:+ start:1901 stop:2395 length:495 start_codon:yes stop_codon:yes gene_type:complete